MIVILDNNLINTQFIWKITPITESGYSGGVYSFSVHFLNSNVITIVKSMTSETPNGQGYFTEIPKETPEELTQIAKDKIEYMYSRIVELWKANQSSIPKINYE